MGIVGLVLSLLFVGGMLLVLGGGAYWLMRGVRFGPRLTPMGRNDESLEIARRRLAAGEITVSEFEEIREQLQG